MTRAELDALAEFTAAGGRLMYLGGNGFYATDVVRPGEPTCRRGTSRRRRHPTPPVTLRGAAPHHLR